MKKTTTILTVLAFAIFAAAALALAGIHGADGLGMFTKDLGEMDTNADTLVTFDEYEAFHSRNLKAAFDMLDANSDNVIDDEEWTQFLNVHGMGKTM